ncbi:MAG: hypothetical protein HXX11_03005 [Desulfuromonadales bacterium]|nr:hypothetical protein [Desulfuromonadales bacterium]
MKRFFELAVILIFCMGKPCFAAWNCDDWVARRGYCVDYVKSRVPLFPIPATVSDILQLNNKNVRRVAKGDVAIFDLGRYWHVAYVENVYRDHYGNAISIDVSEKNYGEKLTRGDFKNKWDSKQSNDWKRAVWCGVTSEYGQTSMRTNVAIDSVDQIWSPKPALFHSFRRGSVAGLLGNAHEVIDRTLRLSEFGL